LLRLRRLSRPVAVVAVAVAASGACLAGAGQAVVQPAAAGTRSAPAAASLGTASLGTALNRLHLRMVRQAPPAACAVRQLRVRVPAATSGRAGAAITVRLSTSGRACSLGDFPAVRLHLAGGASPVAKQFGYIPASRAGMPALAVYVHRGVVRPVLVVRPDRWVRVVLVAPKVRGGACRLARSATLYPADVAVGAGKTVALPGPVAVCGAPRALPFQPAGTVSSAVRLAGRALASIEPGRGRSKIPGNDSPMGFWYGSDGPGGVACGSAPYTEASHASASDPCATTNGHYGGYVGEVGLWDRWQPCGAGQAFNNTSAEDATVNYESYADGVGVQGYWMLGGPGRNPNYDNGSATQAYNWGRDQAVQAVNWTSNSIYFVGDSAGPYIYMDIELYSGPNSEFNNGWYSQFSSVCQTGNGTGGESQSLNQDVFNGFWDYLNNNTPLYPAVYNAGGTSSLYYWPNIMGSKTLGNTAEWTWEGTNGSLGTFPSGWSVSGGSSASWFAGAPGKCDTLWQWSGGGGVGNTTGLRFDQFDGNNFPANSSSTCA
jgi:hypothetical protein